jgi:hypothetical protein
MAPWARQCRNGDDEHTTGPGDPCRFAQTHAVFVEALRATTTSNEAAARADATGTMFEGSEGWYTIGMPPDAVEVDRS